ncbi:SH3 domain-containing protein [candidate division WOR-3 bacterium]|nr:SH3 domain-containing protein [candidate division WOR-3 bacterium]
MKKVIIFILIIFIYVFSYSNSIYSIKYGNKSDEIPYIKVPGINIGPSSFYITDNLIYLSDPIKGKILKVENDEISLMFCNKNIRDVSFHENELLLGYDNYIIKGNKYIPLDNIKEPIKFAGIYNDNIYVTTSNGKTYIIDINGKIISNHNGIFYNGNLLTSTLKENGFVISINNINYFINVGYSTASACIEAISDKYVVIIVERFICESPIEVSQEIFIIDYSGNILMRKILPDIHFTYIQNPVEIFDCFVYYGLSTSKEFYIFKIFPDVYPVFPEKLYDNKYHYNNMLIKEDDISSLQYKYDEPITRTEVLNIADAYVTHQFYASSSNLTYGIITDPYGVQVRTPDWVVVGNNTSIPYRWGGFSSLNQFDDGLLADKYAGDIATSGVSVFAVGVDCSGFVSRCWDRSSKYGTSTLPNISTQLSSVNDLRRGDILNNASSHVRLVVEDNPDGTVNTCEASGYDWRVSYRSYNFSSLTGYLPRRYINIIDDTVITNNFVVNVTNCSNLNLREGPGLSYGIISSLPAGNMYISTHYTGNGWYKLIIPSGMGYSYGWCYGGMDSTGYLIGSSRKPVFEVKDFKGTLNMREGPSTDFTVITTVTSGQQFAVIDSSGEWYELCIPNINGHTTGWCSRGNSGSYGEIIYLAPKSPYGAEITDHSYNGTLSSGETTNVSITIKNIGSLAFDEYTYLSVTNPRNHSSLIRDSSWIDSTNICGVPYLLPGQSGQLTFIVRNNAVYDTILNEYITLKEYDYHWFSDSTELGPFDSDFYLSMNLSGSVGIGVLKKQVNDKIVFTQIKGDYISIKYHSELNDRLSYTIYSISGRKIKGGNILKGYNKITVKNMANGCYIIRIGNIYSKKFVRIK